MMPVVSVIIPVRNGERTLARAIDSARGQTFTDGVEVIVVDNGSTDRTCDAIRRYGDRIIALYEPIPGPARARNVAIFVARGEYLAFLDADDEWMPEKLARIIPLLEGDPECVLAYHDAIEIDTAGNIIKKSYYPVGHNSAPSLADLLSGRYPGNPILPTNVVMRRAVAIRVGGFVEEMSALEDVGMWFLVREHGPFRFRAEALARREWEPSVRREDSVYQGWLRAISDAGVALRQANRGREPDPVSRLGGNDGNAARRSGARAQALFRFSAAPTDAWQDLDSPVHDLAATTDHRVLRAKTARAFVRRGGSHHHCRRN